eukprot:gene11421-15305_t
MTADTAIFLQTALQKYAKNVFQGNDWRIFSKLGAGYSTSRYRGEIVTNAYTCLPRYDSEGQVIGGIEFTISGRGSVANDATLIKVEQKLLNAVVNAVDYVMNNEMQ